MKANTTIAMIITMALVIGMTGVGSAVAPATTYDSSVVLDNKNITWALTPDDSIGATIEYNFAADEFEWHASGNVPVAGAEYSLIYYADKPDRFNVWGGNNPGALIATITTDAGTGAFDTFGSINLGMDLPHPNDYNMNPDPWDEYCNESGPDGYDHCTGAKLWMVPSSNYTEPALTAWNPAKYLFDTDLINYTRDTGISIGDVVTCDDVYTPLITIPIVVSNADNVGAVDLTLTYNESLVTVTGVTNGAMDEISYVFGSGQVDIGTYQNGSASPGEEFVLANVEFTPVANGECDFEITVTSFLDGTIDTVAMPYVTRAGVYRTIQYTNGDVNSNGVVDIGDVMVLAKHLVGITGFEDIDECAADVDGTAPIDVNDVAYLARYLLGDPTYTPLK